MGESKQNQHNKKPNQKRHQPKPVITPEQEAILKAAREKAEIEAKTEAERIQKYEGTVEKMTHRQLTTELKRVIRSQYSGRPAEPQPGQTIAFATVLLTMLTNTKTKENPFAKLSSYPR